MVCNFKHSTNATYTDSKGHEIENFLTASNICLMNNKCSTYVHPATGSRSSLDLAFCDPALYLDYSWAVHDDLCGSDHFPVLLKKHNVTPQNDVQRWKLKEADWPVFSNLCTSSFNYDVLCQDEDPIATFVALLTEIAEETIPKTSKQPQQIRNPWFDAHCKAAIDNRKEALKKFKNHPTTENLDKFKITRAQARRKIKSSKRDSWRSYI